MSELPSGQQLLQRIFDGLAEIPALAEAATKAENDYDMAFAAAFIAAEGTVDARKSAVTLDPNVSKLWLAKENAANTSKIAQQSCWNVLPKILSYYQTLSKNSQQTDDTLKYGGSGG